MPVPVHHTKSTGGQMAVYLQAKLSIIWCPSRIALCFGFQNQVVVILETADQITTKCDFCTTQVILGWMINIRSCYSQMFCTFKMVYIRLHAVGISSPLKIQVVGNKLIFPLILAADPGLPA